MRDSIVVILGGRGATVCMCTLKESTYLYLCACMGVCIKGDCVHVFV